MNHSGDFGRMLIFNFASFHGNKEFLLMISTKELKFWHVLLFIVGMLLIKAIPFDEGIQFFTNDQDLVQFLASIFKDGLVLAMACWLILKFQIHQELTLFQFKYLHNLWFLLFPLYFVPILWLMNNPFSGDLTFRAFDFFSVLFQDLLTGLEEEFAFRGVIFGLIIFLYRGKKKGLLKSTILASSLFGVIHLMNLTENLYKWPEIVAQVISAFFLGVLFCSILLRTRALILLGLVHGLLNFSLGLEDLLSPSSSNPVASESLETMMIEGIARIILSVPCLIIGLHLLKPLSTTK